LLLVAGPAYPASGEVYLGNYMEGSRWASQPDNTDGAKWRAGVYLEQDFEWFTPYGEIETTIDEAFGSTYVFHPSSVLYVVGVKIPLSYDLTFTLEHGCWHHIDSDDGYDHKNQQYNRAEIRWRFGGDK
jgi:hypothetical protein